jgi:hypothetical protein
VDELRRLSDTGIYETLKLEKIFDASVEIGDFHYIIHLQIGLSSIFFESQKPIEKYEMMVLESKDQFGKPTGTKSIAIDEFPAMQEDAIEQFWIEMVEARRKRRRQLFKEWTNEKDQNVTFSKKKQQTNRKINKKKLRLEDLQKMSTKNLRLLLSSTTTKISPELRQAMTNIIDERWDKLEKMEQQVVQDQDTTGAIDNNRKKEEL